MLEADLIEPNRVEAEAQVEEANGDAIENPEQHDCLHVDRLGLKEVKPLGRVECAERHH